VDFFRQFFSSDYPPQASCYMWRTDIVWLNAISDALVALAYYSIPFTLLYILHRRPSLRLRGLMGMFAAFILSCGTSRLISVWNVWHGTYGLEGLVKAVTAVLSIATAIMTVKLAPVALRIPSPEELERANEHLLGEMRARAEAEEKLRKAAEAARLSSEARMRSFLEAAAQGFLAIGADGRILLVNRRIEEMFGYRREELIGQDVEILLPERYRGSHVLHRREFFQEPRIRDMGPGMDLAARRKDGTEFPVEVGLSYTPGENGVIALGVVNDITERKRHEDQLSRAHAELRASEATLRRANAELEQFASLASHDMQEPLRMITGYLDLLQRRYADQLDPDAREFIRYAVEGSQRMKNLIRDVLSLSRAGTRPLSKRRIAAQEVLGSALANLNTAISERRAVITASDLPQIVADPGLLAQVFQNLIANAIKFTRNETPRVHISAERRAGEWLFSVRDNGIGIDPAHRERVFRIFERLDASEEFPGSGVGLAICQKIIERHGGRIWVDSAPGQGSVFHFTIPED